MGRGKQLERGRVLAREDFKKRGCVGKGGSFGNWETSMKRGGVGKRGDFWEEGTTRKRGNVGKRETPVKGGVLGKEVF